ncbi:MAG: hypothetical protein ACOC2F_08055, partial [Bacteroidota bacterium]
MANPNKILVVYPLMHQNAPDTTIVWVSEFAKLFEQLYNQVFESTFELEIKSLQTEEEKIDEFLRKVESFLNVFVVLSPELLRNETYLKYLKGLYQAALNRAKSNGSSLRVFNIVRKPVLNVIKEDWLLHFPFYHLIEKTAGVRGFKAIDFSQRIPEESSIWEKLIDLAFDVHASISLAGSSDSHKATIFLAETTNDQDLYRDKIERELKHRGFKVLPETPLPTSLDDLKNELTNIVAQSDLSIHIMGGIYGDYIKSGAYSLIDLQNRIVREVLEKGTNKKKLKRIIWIPPYLKIPDQRQELYLRRLKREETDESTEIIQAPLEDLKSTISKTLRNKDKIAREQLRDKKSVYIIHDYKNTSLIPEIESQIKDQG